MTNTIGKPEIATQKRLIKFFEEKLKYNYIGNLSERKNRNIDEEKLKAWLVTNGYSSGIAIRAVEKLVKAANNMTQGLYSANYEVYELLRYGAKVKESAEEKETTVYFIEWKETYKNLYEIAEEVTVVENNEKRPDLVIYINGIAISVIELKKSTISVSNGIRQNITNQREMFIESFFTTIQFCMAGNDSEGLRYGTIGTPEKYYLEWKKDGFTECPEERDEIDVKIEEICDTIKNRLDRDLFAMFYKKRFLNFIHDFVIFDRGKKKVCRYNQYYGIKRAQKRLVSKKGGIIWNAQGSGKSLTMIWLSKWLLSNIPTARVLIVTDREELDDQIEKNYKGVNEKIIRTRSNIDLITRLNKYEDRLLCSLIHKFGKHSGEYTEEDYEKDYERYIKELKEALPSDFEAKGDIFVFVDECHRTQSGKLHVAMETIMPNAIFVGLTGTPLLASDKLKSTEIFGSYIHTYKFDEAVKDGIILDLRYEARDIPQEIVSEEKANLWFEAKSRGLTKFAKARLKKKWNNIKKLYSSRSRLEKIACDIILDFETKPRLIDGNGNAILVAENIKAACEYYNIFVQKEFKKCAIITSYLPNSGKLRTEAISDEEQTIEFLKYDTYLKMLGINPKEKIDNLRIKSKIEAFEKEAKRKFVEEPYNMKLLIVVDKLLTGFDVPPCTYIYIDKSMQNHALFQAICRVNRLYDENKEFGYIVDYKHLFGNMTKAMKKYTGGAFEGYSEEDVEGLLKNSKIEAKEHFKEILNDLEKLCEEVKDKGEEEDYLHYFCGASDKDIESEEEFSRLRENLYSLVNALVRAYAEIKPAMNELGYSEKEEIEIEKKVKFYINLKKTIGNSSSDFIDLKAYEPGMRHLIDNYIIAEDSKTIGKLEDFTLLDFIKYKQEELNKENHNSVKATKESVAEAIEHNINKRVRKSLGINPKYYNDMSEVLKELIEKRKKGVIKYEELMKKYNELALNVTNPEQNERYPESIRNSSALRALYDNTGNSEKLAVELHEAVKRSKMDRFRNDKVKENLIKSEIFKILNDKNEVERIFKIIVEQEEY